MKPVTSLDPAPPAYCPTIEDLRQFAMGLGAPHRIEQIALHLHQSPTCGCHQRLAELHTESDGFVMTLREARSPVPYAGEAACQLAVLGAAALVPAAARPTAEVRPALENQRVGPYRDLRLLGRGGMGEVYRAFDERLQRSVALKLIRRDRFALDASVQRFRVEAELAARLEHPNIVPVFEVGQSGEHDFLAMKLVEGRPLAEAGHPYREHPRAAVRLMIPLALAIHHAHERQVLHRDLKPGNIILDDQGIPYVTDFGLAKHLGAHSQLTQSGSVVGTPSYMAPEQAAGLHQDVIITTDVYGLGGILYFLLTGRPPIEGDDPVSVLRRVIDCEPIRPGIHNRRVDRDLETVCLKCLSKDPRRRYATALALAEELQRWLDGRPIAARPMPWPLRGARWCRRRPALAALTGAVTALTLLVVVGSPLVAISMKRQAAKTQWHLFESQRSLARAQRSSDRPDRRESGLTAVRRAIATASRRNVNAETWLSLRNEALACLALPLIQQRCTWPLSPVFASDPTGVHYAHVARDGDIHLHRLADGQEIRAMESSDIPIDPLHFSPAGRYLGARIRGEEGKVQEGYRLYAIPEGRLLWSFPRSVRWNRLAFTPDERQILLLDFEGILHQLDVASGRELGAFDPGLGDDYELAVHPRGEKIAFVHRQGRGRSVYVHNLDDGKRVDEFSLPFSVSCLAWSPDGTRLAAGSDGLFCLWDISSRFLLRTFSGHRRLITRITFHPQGRLIATCGYDGATRVWDAETGEALARFPSDSAYFEPASGQLVLAGSSRGRHAVQWWDVALPAVMSTLSMVKTAGMFPRALDLSSDGTCVVAAGDEGVRVWELPSERFRAFLPLPGAFGVVRLPSAGSFLLGSAQGLSELRCPTRGAGVDSYDASDDAGREAFSCHTLQKGTATQAGVFHRVAASQNGQHIAWIADAGRLVLWDRPADTVREIRISPDNPCLAVSPAGHWVVSSDRDGLAVWDFAAADRVTTLGDTLPWCKAIFDRAGTLLVVGDEQRYRCWQTNGWKLRFTVSREVQGLWGTAAFSPDGKVLAISSSRSSVKLLSVESGAELCTLPTAEASMDICHLRFSEDGERILVAGENHVIQVWLWKQIRRQLAELGLEGI